MIKLNELKISYHFQNERNERKDRIDVIINGNFGQVVVEEWYKGAWRCLTDTGICAIVSENKDLILTYYFCPIRTAKMMFLTSGRKMPDYIRNKITKNQSKYSSLFHDDFARRPAA
jgi:hypothetical protein